MSAPVLQGVWGFRTQFLFEAGLFLCGGFWFFRKSLGGRYPAFFSGPASLPLACAAFFSLLSALFSPVRALVAPEWWTFASGAFALSLAASLDPAGRRASEPALRASAWFIALLGLYQGLVIKTPNVSASLTNPNALALFVIMLLPAAAAWRDLPLAGALSALLLFTGSSAAVLALAAAAGLCLIDSGRLSFRGRGLPLLAVLAAAAAFAAWKCDPSSLADRLDWWRAALRMFADRPLLGAGAGSFAYLYPAYHAVRPGEAATVYAHNYYLEFMAENGALAAACWFWFIAARFRSLSGFRRYSAAAALVHSCVDFGLSVPGNFLVFCCLLGGSEPGGGEKPAHKPFVLTAAAAALGCFFSLCGTFSVQLRLEDLRAGAMSALSAGDFPAAERLISAAARLDPDNPLAPALLGRVRMREGLENRDRRALFGAAVAFERALALNPYDADSYYRLETIYRAVGEEELRADLSRRKAEKFRLSGRQSI